MISFLFLLIFNLNYVISSEELQIGNKNTLDNSTIVVTLENYNVSNPEGESIEFLYSLSPTSISKITLTNISADVHFIVLQVHSYLLNVTLSYDKFPFSSNSITGTNIGLIKLYFGKDLSFYVIQKSSLDFVDVMIAVQAYKANAPVPGGCNMEFPVEISPFLLTVYNDAVTEVSFAPSSPPVPVFPNSFSHSIDECNIKPSPVKHQMYHRYFPERDFSKETYFNMLKSMMTKGRILKDAILVSEKPTVPPTRRFFASYPGTGNAFVVLTYFGNETAVYVPSFTYGCNDLKENNTCLVLTTTFSQLLCASTLFLGLFACFIGHNFFRTEIFLFGFLVSGLITYILVSISFTSANILSTSVTAGLTTATAMLLLWTVFGLPIISVILATLTFGFLLASVILHPLTGEFSRMVETILTKHNPDGLNGFVDSLVLDINFWGIFIGITISCPILMLCLAEKANIISSAFMGSYVAVMSIDYYSGSNLRYIVLNTIRRAVAENFRLAIIDPPFQLTDTLLSVVWVILMISGTKIQLRLMRNKPPYPPPLPPTLVVCFNKYHGFWKKRREPSKPSDENTPLWRGSVPNPVPFYSGENLAQNNGNLYY